MSLNVIIVYIDLDYYTSNSLYSIQVSSPLSSISNINAKKTPGAQDAFRGVRMFNDF